MKKQSYLDRANRMLDGRCPIHGYQMGQIGVTDDGACSIVECPRCGIRAVQTIDVIGPCIPVNEDWMPDDQHPNRCGLGAPCIRKDDLAWSS